MEFASGILNSGRQTRAAQHCHSNPYIEGAASVWRLNYATFQWFAIDMELGVYNGLLHLQSRVARAAAGNGAVEAVVENEFLVRARCPGFRCHKPAQSLLGELSAVAIVVFAAASWQCAAVVSDAQAGAVRGGLGPRAAARR